MTKTTDNRHHMPLVRRQESKKLYHFTSKRAARKIVVQGLKANWVVDMPAELIGAMRGVWLTDDPQLPPKFSASAERRIELAIPANDVLVVHWRSMLRERISSAQLAAIDLEASELKSFYFYFGDIDARSIRSVEPYSSLSEMKACREAHFEKLAELGIE